MICGVCRKKNAKACEKKNPGEGVCKGCCISGNGHYCNWFNLCW